MTMILLHVDDRRIARIDIDPATIAAETRAENFAVATNFQGGLFEAPGVIVGAQTRVGTFLDAGARFGPGPATLKVSCGSTESYPIIHRLSGARMEPILQMPEGEEVPADKILLIDLMTETQKHFVTRIPRVMG